MNASRARVSVYVLVGLLASATLAVNIETVPVGDPGNAGDTRYPDTVSSFGAVNYGYNIGKYEVTAGQYCDFLNAVAKTDTYGLYNTFMWSGADGCKVERTGSPGSYGYRVASDYANRPVNYVSYWDACRFTNWMHNAQPTGTQGPGTTETGAYTLNGYNGYDGRTVQRNAGWRWAITSEDEWYKAAYYKGGSTNAGYWDYPTRSDTDPGRDMADVSGNNANYRGNPYPIDSGTYYTTVVGEFQYSASPYDTFDQGGNLWEWNEALFYGSGRGMRGGSFSVSVPSLIASARSYYVPTYEGGILGFRLAYVPEPAELLLLALGGMAVIRRRHEGS